MSFSVLAVMCLSNEADIIAYTAAHVIQQGCGLYIIDNWSSDGSAEIVRDLPLAGYEKFPPNGPSKYYSWEPLLHRVEAVAAASSANWIIHYDSDEIRRSPRPGESLLDGLARVEREGYNAVNFQVYHFLPTDNDYQGDPERHFKHYTLAHEDCHMRQVKAWKNVGRVDLASVGGHFAGFPGIRVHPQKFILKHYPIRTVEQGRRKVIRERLNRYDPHETRDLKWHVQYKGFTEDRQWIVNPTDPNLRVWTGV